MYFIEYDEPSEILKIGFNDGTIGYFKDVPPKVINEFDLAESKGNYFYQHLYKAGYKTEIRVI